MLDRTWKSITIYLTLTGKRPPVRDRAMSHVPRVTSIHERRARATLTNRRSSYGKAMLLELSVWEEAAGSVAADCAGDWPGMVICSVCADCPGRTCGVYAGGYCRNFCPKPGVECDPPGPAIEPGEKVCKIPLTQGLFALVDPEDYEELNKYKWCAARSDGICYAVRRGRTAGRSHASRIMKTPDGMVVDHIYGNGLDNRKRYMRNGTKAQNSYNHRPPRGGTGFKGVKYVALTGKYQATVGYKRRNDRGRGVRRSYRGGQSARPKSPRTARRIRLSELPR